MTMGRATGTKTERSQISVRAHVCGDQNLGYCSSGSVRFVFFKRGLSVAGTSLLG